MGSFGSLYNPESLMKNVLWQGRCLFTRRTTLGAVRCVRARKKEHCAVDGGTQARLSSVTGALLGMNVLSLPPVHCMKSTQGSQGESDGETERQQAGPLFSCRTDNAKVLTATLTCLLNGTKKDQLAQVEVSETGIVFIVTGRAKFTQSQGTISSELFDSYECAEGGGRFTINLPLLLECLQIFGPSSVANTSLTMSYEIDHAVLKLTLEEQGVLTTCEINTMEEGEDVMDLAALATAFRRSGEVFRAILKSDQLREAILDLSDMPGASTVTIRVSPHDPHFHLSADGNYGIIEIRFPRTCEAFVHFDCRSARQFRYLLGALNQGMRALSVAKETYVRINEDGIMCVQHQVENVQGKTTYIDFLMCATDYNNDEEEEGQEQEEGGGGGSQQQHNDSGEHPA